jgi:HPr kinase/phosphorylase
MAGFEVHASAVVVGEAGILIRGESGSGKSRLALTLIASAHAGGVFACLVGDDRIILENANGRLIARGHPLILGQIEQRSAGILAVRFIGAAVLRLIVDLVPAGEARRYPEPADERESKRSEDWNFSGLGVADLSGVRLPALRASALSAAADLTLIILQRFRLTAAGSPLSKRIRPASSP